VLAVISDKPGPAHTLEIREVDEPQPGTGQVRVQVRACALNYPDALMIEDLYQFKPLRPFSPGVEVSGILEDVPGAATSFAPGTRVAAYPGVGGLAQKVVVDVADIYPIPDRMPFEIAASLLVAYGTAIHALLDRGQLEKGETILILGAAGGVGYAALELAKALGARVVAAVSSEQKAKIVRDRGADEVVIYPSTVTDPRELAGQFKAACPGGADVIFDPLGGPYAEPALRAIGWEGRYLVIGFAAGIQRIPANLPLLKGCQIVGVLWGVARRKNWARQAELVNQLFQYYENGLLQPVICRFAGLESAPAAIAALKARNAMGKLVVTM
jgi:NADPH:quinone reductase